MHDDWPAWSWNAPSGHGVARVAPAEATKNPGAAGVHGDDPVAEYEPAAHTTDTVWKAPASHGAPATLAVPRWSVRGHDPTVPFGIRPIAALAATSAIVRVGPPLAANPAGSSPAGVLNRLPVAGAAGFTHVDPVSTLYPPSITGGREEAALHPSVMIVPDTRCPWPIESASSAS